MLELAGRTIFLGGFHDHWSRADGGNPSLLLAALNYYHYDFICLMDGNSADADVQRAAAAWSNRIKIYLGREEFYGWGHLVTLTPRAPQLPQDDPDWERVLKKTKANYDLLMLAHPSHHRTWKEIFLTGKMDRLIDEGFIDGVQMHPDSPELVAWFQKRDQAGKLTPIVSGWDLHLVKSLEHLPPVLYTPQRPPNGHYEAPCTTRTLVLLNKTSWPTSVMLCAKGGRSWRICKPGAWSALHHWFIFWNATDIGMPSPRWMRLVMRLSCRPQPCGRAGRLRNSQLPRIVLEHSAGRSIRIKRKDRNHGGRERNPLHRALDAGS